jgi:hypothetical protein
MNPSADDLIHQALDGLRQAQPSTGLDRRILRALETRPCTTVRRPFWLWPAALATAALLLTLTLARPHNLPIADTAHVERPAAPATIAPLPASPNPTRTRPPQPHSLSPQPSPSPSADQLALDDAHAPSHPAPPIPLTAQEKVLLRAARPGAPLELAELEPMREAAFRAAAEAREKAAIEQYVHRILAPLALSESVNPNPPAESPAPPPAQPPAADATAQPDSNQP